MTGYNGNSIDAVLARILSRLDQQDQSASACLTDPLLVSTEVHTHVISPDLGVYA